MLADLTALCTAGGGPFPGGAKGPGDHLRNVFYRMGFNDQEIVALSGKLSKTGELVVPRPVEEALS